MWNSSSRRRSHDTSFYQDYFLYFTLSSLQTHPVAAFMLAPKVVTLASRQLENFNCFSVYKSTLTVAAPFFWYLISFPRSYFLLYGYLLEHPGETLNKVKTSTHTGKWNSVCCFVFSEFSSCFISWAAHNFPSYIHINWQYNKLLAYFIYLHESSGTKD